MRKLWNPRGLPDQLWHFTTVEGKESIEANRELWATRLQKLHNSDRLEWRLGWSTLRNVMEGIVETEDSEIGRIALTKLSDDAGPFADKLQAHVACFTEEGPLETTRHHFERMEKGEFVDISVERELSGYLSPRAMHKIGMHMIPVRYDLDAFIDIADYVIRGVLSKQENRMQDNQNLETSAAGTASYWALRTPFTLMSLGFKRPRYRVEAEWRLVAVHQPENAQEDVQDILPIEMADIGKPLDQI
ncbi:MAG: hypothetical protein ACPGQL_02955 [Thermoplasmatota archaeon]